MRFTTLGSGVAYGLASTGMSLVAPDGRDPLCRDGQPTRLGIRAIDEDHAAMGRQIDRFMGLLDADAAQEPLAQAANDFFQMTMNHFAAEERLMEITGYPDMERHADQHALLMRILLDWWRGFVSGGAYTLPRDDRAFLVEWFADHIDTEDRWLAEHLRQHGYG